MKRMTFSIILLCYLHCFLEEKENTIFLKQCHIAISHIKFNGNVLTEYSIDKNLYGFCKYFKFPKIFYLKKKKNSGTFFYCILYTVFLYYFLDRIKKKYI